MVDLLGLDIGSTTLKAAQIRGKALIAFSYSPAPKGASLIAENKESWIEFSQAVAQLVVGGKFRGRNAVAALPESQIFTRVVTLPKMSETEIDAAIKSEAQQYVPLPLEQTTLDYEVLGTSEMDSEKIDVLLVAAPELLIQRYLNVLRRAGLRPVSLEPETMALSRSVVGDTSGSSAMVVSLGAKTADISIFSGNALRFTRSIPTGGEALVRAVSQSFSLETERAREYLKSYGLLEKEAGGKVLVAIKPVFDIIVEELRRALTFYSSRRGKHIDRIVLVGGVANLPGILIYLAEALGVEVIRADPWEKLSISESFPKEELARLAPDFAVAVGLALKEV